MFVIDMCVIWLDVEVLAWYVDPAASIKTFFLLNNRYPLGWYQMWRYPHNTGISSGLFVHVFTDLSDSDLLAIHSVRLPYLVVCLQHICSRPSATSEEKTGVPSCACRITISDTVM